MKIKLAQLLIKLANKLVSEEVLVGYIYSLFFPGKVVIVSIADSEEEAMGSLQLTKNKRIIEGTIGNDETIGFDDIDLNNDDENLDILSDTNNTNNKKIIQ